MSLMRGAAIAIAFLLAAYGCASFDATNDPTGGGDAGTESGADGGSSDGEVAATVEKRDLIVVVEWPANAGLDPARDAQLSKIVVTLSDAASSARTRRLDAQKSELGPYPFLQFESSGQVDAVVELRSADDRLIGFGTVARADVSTTNTVTVVARRRLLYAIRGDGAVVTDERELVAIDLAPSAFAEPAVNVYAQPLVTLPWASALVMTSDARWLAVAHANPSAPTTGGVTVFETSSHDAKPMIDVPFAPGEMIALGDGPELLVMPGPLASTTAMKRVNVATGMTSDAATGLQGGSVDIVSAVVTFDKKKVLLAGNHRPSPGATSKPYLLEYDVQAGTAAVPIEIPDINRVTSARWTAGGDFLVVAGWQGADEDHCSGRLVTFTPGRTMPTTRAALGMNVSKASNVAVHPSGKRIFLSSDPEYVNASAFSGDFYVFDEAWNLLRTFPMKVDGPEFGITSAVRLPYAPFRVIGGQSDPANNYHGSLVELPADTNVPVEISVNGYTSSASIVSLATPFGQRL